jgi:nicotinamidase-related amidase
VIAWSDMRIRAGQSDLHGSAPDSSPVVLLVIDAINDFTFDEARGVLSRALPMARRIRRLKARTRSAGVSTVYVNDNFGRWRSDFRSLIQHCSHGRGRAVTRLLQPGPRDYFVLKPKHSAFYSTTLELLLEHLGTRTLILTGLLTDSCILLTAYDAHMRGYDVVVLSDCVAARTPSDHRRALAQIRRALNAEVRASTALDLGRLLRRAGRDARGRQAARRSA